MRASLADMESQGRTRDLQTVLQAGDQLLGLLQTPPVGEELDRMQILLQKREEALNRLRINPEPGMQGGLVPEEVKRLLAQQEALEAQMKQVMIGLAQAMQGSQAARANLESFRRLLKPDGRSQRLNQIR